MRHKWIRIALALSSGALQLGWVTPRYQHPQPIAFESVSVGYPWRGRLTQGVRLDESNYLRYTGESSSLQRFFGTTELIDLIDKAAEAVGQELPGALLSVGDISKRGGGDIPGHNSHENGRDVDLLFFVTDVHGEPYDPYALADFNADGTGRPPDQHLRFDSARNWILLSTILSDDNARVQYVFVARTIQRLLLQEGERRGANAALLERARQVMMEPKKGHAHRNHFHVRIYCHPDDKPSCRDSAPYHPWYPGVIPSEFGRGPSALPTPIED